jgi:DNA-binding MarR family transcriptional regulator
VITGLKGMHAHRGKLLISPKKAIHMVLSKNEQLVLYGLSEYPNLMDREVAERIGVRPSTFSTAKKKLKEQGYYSKVKIPMLQSLGCELLYVAYGKLNPLVPYEERLSVAKEMNHRASENIFVVSEPSQAFSLSVSESCTEFYKNKEMFEQVYSEHGFFAEEGFNYAVFPFKLSKTLKFLEFAPLLRNAFNLEVEEERQVTDVDVEIGEAELNEREKRVYYGLVSYPELGDKALSEAINVSRNAIRNARERFEEEGLIKTACIPDLKKLGFQILAISHAKFNPRAPLSVREKGIEMVVNEDSFFFVVSGNRESVQFAVAKDFGEYQGVRDEIIRFYREHDFLAKDPNILLFSIPAMKILKNFEYAPLVRKVLKLGYKP